MKLQGTKTSEVNISTDDILKAAISIIEAKYKIIDCFLNTEKTEVRTDDIPYHGSISDRLVRNATDKDRQAFSTVKFLLNAVRDK